MEEDCVLEPPRPVHVLPSAEASPLRPEVGLPLLAHLDYLRGKVDLEMDKPREAIAAFHHAIALRPAESGAYYQLGLAYRKSGQQGLAKEQFDRVEYLKSQPARP